VMSVPSLTIAELLVNGLSPNRQGNRMNIEGVAE
jgi:hypothetical protein